MPRTKALKLVGRRFGRLKVTAETTERQPSNAEIVWECHCRCGSIIFVHTSNLVQGNTLSCGCWQREISKRPINQRAEYAREKKE